MNLCLIGIAGGLIGINWILIGIKPSLIGITRFSPQKKRLT